MSKRFINSKETVVHEAIDGLCSFTPNVARLDGYPDTKVVVRTDWDKNAGKVAIISGGGSGHEPFCAGFLGEGMLTAAVCGNVFASPSQDAVLAAIVAVTGPAGCVLVVLNYTGDRFNFGIAAARAKNEYGLDVRIVIVSDDVAIPDAKQPRGLMGTLYTIKIAGAAANEGCALDEVEQQAFAVAACAKSLGVSFSSCTLPGADKKEERMAEDQMEVGLGIHGEPGASKVKIGTANEVVLHLQGGTEVHTDSASRASRVVAMIATTLKKNLPEAGDVALMVGNLGSVPPVEMSIVTGALLKQLPAKLLVGPALLCTSLDMNGIQVSALPLTGQMQARLAAPTTARAWPGAVYPQKVRTLPMPLKPPPSLEEASPSRDVKIEALIKGVCITLCDAQKELDDIDQKVGDGDCGSTMKEGAELVAALLGKVSSNSPKMFLTAVGRALNSVGGSSGVLLSIMFTTMAGTLEEGATWDRASISPAFAQGVATLMQVGGAKVGMRTMVDVLQPVSEAMVQGSSLDEIVKLAKDKADNTANIASTNFGRSQYLNAETLKGEKDPGAIAASMVVAKIAAGC